MSMANNKLPEHKNVRWELLNKDIIDKLNCPKCSSRLRDVEYFLSHDEMPTREYRMSTAFEWLYCRKCDNMYKTSDILRIINAFQ